MLPLRISRQSFPRLTRLYSQSSLEAKYAQKLRKRAQEAGTTVEELKAKIKSNQQEAGRQNAIPVYHTDGLSIKPSWKPSSEAKGRKDSSPVKPLDTILNLPRIMATPHSAAQVSSLWTAYHLSRSGGTGRGYLCASIPLPLYLKMEAVGQKYPSFVVALPRPKNPSDDQLAENGSDTAYEFYFLQWNFHDRPPAPSPENNPFVTTTPAPSKNPQISTVLFTPLQEYKLRGAYATPYLVLTHYTDLASTHGISLLRGEITASSTSNDRYLLGQADAQLLSMALQKFYLWGENKEDGDSERLLRTFHDNPGEFKWKELLKFASLNL